MTDIPTPFLKCRALGHMWDEFVPTGRRKPEWGVHYALICINCGAERFDTIDALGKVGQRKYYYPDDYSLDYKLSRAEAKLELLERRDRYIRKARKRRYHRG